jgi:hypothetical protein
MQLVARTIVEDNILPVGSLDTLPQCVIFLPKALVVNPDFVVEVVVPEAGVQYELPGGVLRA